MVKLKMKVLIAICCVACVAVVSAMRGKPPSIALPQSNVWPDSTVYVRKGSNATLYDCSAKAQPPATYYWTYNGEPLVQDERTVTVLPNGTLKTGLLFGPLHSGDYQCYATNEYGTAMTPILTLLATDANTFTGSDSEETRRQSVSLYMALECKNVPKSVPEFELSWMKGYYDKDDKLKASPVQPDDRVVVDPQGTLHFLWLDWSDNNLLFACSASNPVMHIAVRNTQIFKVKVQDGDETLDKSLTLKYNKNVQVNAGDDAELVCIFAYYSAGKERVNITWSFGPKVVGYGTKLVIPNVKLPSSPNDPESQEGEYRCTARLGSQKEYGNVNLKIVAPPKFVRKPEGRDVLLGADAVMHCETYSHNTHSEPPVWFINTRPLIGCPDRLYECKKPLQDEYSECIPEKLVCDADPDCGDGSDEYDCPGICAEGQKLCLGQCIPNSKVCNDTCVFPSFMCRDGIGCVKPEDKCDGLPNCFDESDEIGCPGKGSSQRNRYMLNSARTELVVPRVSIQDSMCIQCLVRNEYGSTIGDACITVIDEIIVLRAPNSTYYVEPGMLLDITVEATTDVLYQNQMSYRWYWYAEQGPTDKKTGITPIVPVLLPPKGFFGKYFRTDLNGRNMVIQFPDVTEDDMDMYNAYNTLKDRVYTLVIEHNYDRVELNFTITGVEIVKPTVAPAVQAASANLWFIALILAILILFIVVALIVCYMYRNRGGTYLLGKKERQAGHDPAQELKDSGFHDVGRVDDDYDDADKPRADEASLSESVKPYESDDDPTEEYGGDFDVSKFNEDGSFIGLYGDKKSKYSTKEATV